MLDSYVSDIHAHHPMMGYRSIRDILALQFGWIVCDFSVLKSMQRLHIQGYSRKNKHDSSGSGLFHARYSNLLQRDFRASAPLQKVVTDVTCLKFRGQWYYLAGYLDLFNNEILEWELSDSFDNLLVMKPAERLLKRTESTKHHVLLHSDQGVQYSSAGYGNLLTRYNAIQSMSRAALLTTMPLWRVSGAGLRIPSANTSVIGKSPISLLSLLTVFTTSTSFALFVSSTENRQSCSEQNWRLDRLFVSTNY